METLESRVVLSGISTTDVSALVAPIALVRPGGRNRSNAPTEGQPGPGQGPGGPRRRHHAPFSDAGMMVSRNIEYPSLNGRTNRLDVYRPTGNPPAGGWPVILAIHGGGWYHFSKRQYGQRIATAFVRKGFVVVAPNYLLSRQVSPSWPMNLEDVRSAVRWTRNQASSLGIDVNRIVAMGESAGGNLAELLGTGTQAISGSGQSDRVSAVVSFSGPADLRTLYQQSPDAGSRAVRFLGGTPSAVPESYSAASPVDQVSPGNPPMLLIHGSADPLVPVGQSKEMDAALTAAGVPHRLIILPGGTHAINYPGRYSNLTPQILAFLNEAWNHKG
ncbi:MAG: hypothetical protein ABS79_06745 [Planctomycetes bacterium SCN 63-9]|nr:MAG: hypothetical protein ABS79_06745 [Planctomycetes bacterium SCN 63-9]